MTAKSVVNIGDKVHIITRRRFESDVRRHFAGEITAVEAGLCRVEGYAFVFQQGANEYRKRPDPRVRLFSIGEEGFIVFVIPNEVVIDELTYRTVDNRLVVTDDKDFTLDINEFGESR
jgi:hypothetical protein